MGQEEYRSLAFERTTEEIVIDGSLEEGVWQSVPSASDFTMVEPNDTASTTALTEVWVAFDDKYLYVAAKCHTPNKEKTIIQSLKRDFSFDKNDGFTFAIDAFDNTFFGLSFGLSSYGVQRDGIIARGGTKGVTTAWDGKWLGEVQRYDDHWSLEMAIPFRTLRYKDDAEYWKVNFARRALGVNETTTWASVENGFNVATLSRCGKGVWASPPPENKLRPILIPYSAITLSKDVANNGDIDVEWNPGLDAKLALSSSLNMDITINPDFSQVEVDEQVINLSRFELDFPERRLFFTENSDVFGALGNSRVSPFFSRRIGGVGSSPVPILGGLKLSGNINKDWRIGLLSVQTEGVRDVDDAQNWTAAVAEYQVREGLAVNAFVLNRQAFSDFKWLKGNYNTVVGGDMVFNLKDSKYTGNAYVHYATTGERLKNSMFYGGKIRYRESNFSLFAGLDAVGENYITEMGFVPRLYHTDDSGNTVRIGYQQARLNGYYRLRPKWAIYTGPTAGVDLWIGNDYSYQEHEINVGWETKFNNNSELLFEYTRNNPVLFYSFNLSGLDTSFAPGNYMQDNIGFEYVSDERKIFFGEISSAYGDKFLGKEFDFSVEANYRAQPWGVFGLSYTNKRLFDFPSEYGDANFHLVGGKFEISFSRYLFWTTFLQYNTQKNNFNINTRFNWRFAPMSDLFIVFTDNYTTEDLEIKNWSFVIKASYWIDFK